MFACVYLITCRVYNNIHHPSKLAVGADLHCFKEKIEPKWEDPVCANGGKWTVTFSRGKSDTCWLHTVCLVVLYSLSLNLTFLVIFSGSLEFFLGWIQLLAMIGEQFDHGDEICGAVVNVRARQEKIALWTKNAPNEAAQVCLITQPISCNRFSDDQFYACITCFMLNFLLDYGLVCCRVSYTWKCITFRVQINIKLVQNECS